MKSKRVLVFHERETYFNYYCRDSRTECTIDFRDTSQKRDQTFSTASSRITPLDVFARVRRKIACQVADTSRATIIKKKNLFKIINYK